MTTFTITGIVKNENYSLSQCRKQKLSIQDLSRLFSMTTAQTVRQTLDAEFKHQCSEPVTMLLTSVANTTRKLSLEKWRMHCKNIQKTEIFLQLCYIRINGEQIQREIRMVL
jgi:hypothetical protein